jgi:hypothetical protein
MASPFKKKSPLNAYKYSLTSSYANPKGVIQPIVEAEAAKAIGDASKKVLGVFSKIEADKKAKKASDEAGDLKHQRAMEVKWGKGNTGPAVKPASHEENMSNLGLKSYKNTQVEDFMNRDFGGNKAGRENLSNNIEVKSGKNNKYTYKMAYNNLSEAKRKEYGSLDSFSKKANETAIPGSKNYANKDGTRDEVNSTPWNPQMKGSPNKLIGDTMDPYGQPQRGNRDFTFNENEIAPGTLGSQASMGVQKEIFGGGQAQVAAEQLAAEQLQAPLLSKGHGVKQAHTHPSKTTTKMKPVEEYPGARYVKGDLVDQEDLLDKTGLDVHSATQVQSDKKGSFIKEKPDSGPGSDIETSKGFGKKIRLESMGRSSYTVNMKDQLDPHDFLFKNTPKNNKKK